MLQITNRYRRMSDCGKSFWFRQITEYTLRSLLRLFRENNWLHCNAVWIFKIYDLLRGIYYDLDTTYVYHRYRNHIRYRRIPQQSNKRLCFVNGFCLLYRYDFILDRQRTVRYRCIFNTSDNIGCLRHSFPAC